jgi:hypothetical protein
MFDAARRRVKSQQPEMMHGTEDGIAAAAAAKRRGGKKGAFKERPLPSFMRDATPTQVGAMFNHTACI